jgi:hypothetical protein
MQNVLILSDEILAVIKTALMNHKACETNPVMNEIDMQLRLADTDPAKFMQVVRHHTQRFNDAIETKNQLSELQTLRAEKAARDARQKKKVA